MLYIDRGPGFAPCPSDFCQGGTHVERLCNHSGNGCPCGVFERPCRFCGGAGFIAVEDDATDGSLSRPPLEEAGEVRRVG